MGMVKKCVVIFQLYLIVMVTIGTCLIPRRHQGLHRFTANRMALPRSRPGALTGRIAFAHHHGNGSPHLIRTDPRLPLFSSHQPVQRDVNIIRQTVVLNRNRNIVVPDQGPGGQRGSSTGMRRGHLGHGKRVQVPGRFSKTGGASTASNKILRGHVTKVANNTQNANMKNTKNDPATRLILLPSQPGEKPIIVHASGSMNVSRVVKPDGSSQIVISTGQGSSAGTVGSTTLPPEEIET